MSEPESGTANMHSVSGSAGDAISPHRDRISPASRHSSRMDGGSRSGSRAHQRRDDRDPEEGRGSHRSRHHSRDGYAPQPPRGDTTTDVPYRDAASRQPSNSGSSVTPANASDSWPANPRRRSSHERHPDRKRTSSRSRSPDLSHAADTPRKRRRHHHQQQHTSGHTLHAASPGRPVDELPFGARALSRSKDLAAFAPLLAHYLDVQKQLDMAALDEREVRGRWKSFVGKWNRGELAEGWYEPELFARVAREAGGAGRNRGAETGAESTARGGMEAVGRRSKSSMGDVWQTRGSEGSANAPMGTRADRAEDDNGDDDEDEEDYGPSLPPSTNPGSESGGAKAMHGPELPTQVDFELRRELEAEARQAGAADLREARKADRAEQRERLDELVPRADAGTRERRLEKKRAVNDKMREFREPDAAAEVGDGELMGGGEDGADEYRRAVTETRRRKTEWEARREEIHLARMAEREVKLRKYRDREEGTMGMLRELAKKRFG